MRKTLILLAALVGTVGLTGCDSPEERAEERMVIQSRLPDNCAFVDLGSYSKIRTVVAVICDGRATTSTNTSWSEQSGKTTVTRNGASVVLQ